MNNVLQLKGRFEKRKNERQFGSSKLPVKSKVSSEHIKKLLQQLLEVKQYWMGKNDIRGVLISVYYTRVVAKSNRLRFLLSDVGKKPVDSIRGARFLTVEDMYGTRHQKHVFTHYVQMSAIDRAIDNLKIVVDIIEKEYQRCITAEDIDRLGKEKKL